MDSKGRPDGLSFLLCNADARQFTFLPKSFIIFSMMKKPKFLICDIDGTIVEKGEDPGPITLAVLKRLHDDGVMLGLASGRPVEERTIRKFIQWGLDFECDVVIGFNGNQMWNRFDRRIEEIELMGKKENEELLSYLWDLDVNVIVYENGYNKVLAKRWDPILKESQKRNNSNVVISDRASIAACPTCKLEIRYEDAFEEELMKIVAAHPSGEYSHIKTFTGTLEFMKPGIDKGRALKMVCEKLDIPLEDVVACGDMDNDAEMIRTAGTGICLLNGSEVSKKAADFITDYDVAHDGLGLYLDKIFYGGM